MKVYVVLEQWAYESSNAIAVMSTEEKALELVVRLEEKNTADSRGYDIEEFEIDNTDLGGSYE
jgi:hypothetical protein